MTLNEWEQRNIEVLTSREMGEWLSRRENRLLEQIRAEINDVAVKTQNEDKREGLYIAREIVDRHI